MSRSRKKHPIFGITTAQTEKVFKRLYNRGFRKATKQAIERGKEPIPHIKGFASVWNGPKDGKMYRNNPGEKYLRK